MASTEQSNNSTAQIIICSAPSALTLLSEAVLQEMPVLHDYIDVPTLLPHLTSQKLLTLTEHSQLTKKWEEGKTRETITCMLELLHRKEPQWCEGLLKALERSKEHRGHGYIVEVLMKTVDCLQSNGSKQTNSYSHDIRTLTVRMSTMATLQESMAACKLRQQEPGDFEEVEGKCCCGCEMCCSEIKSLREDKRRLEILVRRSDCTIRAIKEKIDEMDHERM